jgi:hypothetical protein
MDERVNESTPDADGMTSANTTVAPSAQEQRQAPVGVIIHARGPSSTLRRVCQPLPTYIVPTLPCLYPARIGCPIRDAVKAVSTGDPTAPPSALRSLLQAQWPDGLRRGAAILPPLLPPAQTLPPSLLRRSPLVPRHQATDQRCSAWGRIKF